MNTTNINTVISELKKAGITNEYAIAGILAIIKKESGFLPKSELSYTNTSNTRIKEIFSKTRTLSDPQLTELKKDSVKFFNFVYGGLYGNKIDEGYKYRGRGFNQLTFKNNYAAMAKLIGIDIVSNPDIVNKPEVAAKIVAAYMKQRFEQNKAIVKQRYNVNNINDFKDTKTAVNAFYNANAGFGKDTSTISTSGKTEALKAVASLYTQTTKFLNTNTGKISSVAILLALGTIFYLSQS